MPGYAPAFDLSGDPTFIDLDSATARDWYEAPAGKVWTSQPRWRPGAVVCFRWLVRDTVRGRWFVAGFIDRDRRAALVGAVVGSRRDYVETRKGEAAAIFKLWEVGLPPDLARVKPTETSARPARSQADADRNAYAYRREFDDPRPTRKTVAAEIRNGHPEWDGPTRESGVRDFVRQHREDHPDAEPPPRRRRPPRTSQ